MIPNKSLRVRLAIAFRDAMWKLFHQSWIVGYGATCDHCYAQYDRLLFRVVGIISDTATDYIVVPRIVENCKVCHRPILAMRIYKTMEVTSEFSRIKKEQK